jgi:putative transposase
VPLAGAARREAGGLRGAAAEGNLPNRSSAFRSEQYAMNSQTKREYLRELVDGRNQAFRPLTDDERALGFLGWHERGNLPHCDYPGLVQFVTFRLADSMPQSRRGEWEHLLAIENVREKRTKLEEYLDRGIGACHLRDPANARLTEAALLHSHSEHCDLLSWCVMPNHVHVLVHVWQTPLWKLVAAWKKFVARRADRMPERRSPHRPVPLAKGTVLNGIPAIPSFWMREYWDTFMRDEEQERRAIRYIEGNPVKAKLCSRPEDWPFSSARFRDQYKRLEIPAGK